METIELSYPTTRTGTEGVTTDTHSIAKARRDRQIGHTGYC